MTLAIFCVGVMVGLLAGVMLCSLHEVRQEWARRSDGEFERETRKLLGGSDT